MGESRIDLFLILYSLPQLLSVGHYGAPHLFKSSAELPHLVRTVITDLEIQILPSHLVCTFFQDIKRRLHPFAIKQRRRNGHPHSHTDPWRQVIEQLQYKDLILFGLCKAPNSGILFHII